MEPERSELRAKQRASSAACQKLKKQLDEISHEEEAMRRELEDLKAEPACDSKSLLRLYEELKQEEERLLDLKQTNQLCFDQSASKLRPRLSSALQAEASLQRISDDLALDLKKQSALQAEVQSQLQHVDTQCSRLAGRLQLKMQMASKLRQEFTRSTQRCGKTEDSRSDHLSLCDFLRKICTFVFSSFSTFLLASSSSPSHAVNPHS